MSKKVIALVLVLMLVMNAGIFAHFQLSGNRMRTRLSALESEQTDTGMQDTDKKITELEAALAQTDAAWADANAALAAAGEEITGLKTAADSANAALADTNAALEAANGEIAGLKTEVGSLNTALSDTGTALDDANARLAGLRAELAATNEALMAANAEIAALQAGQAVSEAPSETEEGTETADSELDAVRADLEAVNAALSAAGFKIDALQNDLSATNSSLADTNVDLSDTKAALDTLSGGIAAMQTDLAAAETALAAMSADVEALKEKTDFPNGIYVPELPSGYDGTQPVTLSPVNQFRLVGNYVVFGRYEQDGDTLNGTEPIEWLVLDYDQSTDRALLITRYALERQPYNVRYENITWEKSSLRTWLNNKFLYDAFTELEMNAIPTVTVPADMNPEHGTDPGNATEDKAFLLSAQEAEKYFDSDQARMCVPTAYAVSQGVYTSPWYYLRGSQTCYWWLRTPGSYRNFASRVSSDGAVYMHGTDVSYNNTAVRPALWIDLSMIY